MNTQRMRKYIYVGPVMMFETCIANQWKGETMAVSEAKARSNLIFQFKKSSGRLPSSKISLPGKVVCIE